jgi:ABC-2 type transport system permease protein
MGIWIKASETGNIGLTSIEFARYFLAAFIVRQSNVVWVIWEFEKEVIQGKLSPRLLQPIDPVWHHFLSHIAERFARFPFIVGLILLFFALYPESFWIPSLGQTLLFLLVLILAFMLRFIIQYTFALLSFWIERASAIEKIWGFASNHGRHLQEGQAPEYLEAELVVELTAAIATYLGKKLGGQDKGQSKRSIDLF